MLGLGFILGLQHSFDADHIVAISNLTSKHKSLKKAVLIGGFWGIGHTVTLLIFGTLIIILKISFSQKISLAFEFLVGLMISILGISLLIDTLKNKKHEHIHEHNGKKHVHIHSHKKDNKHKHTHSFIVGSLHGVAGSAGLMLVVLQSVNSIYLAILYILIFGIGSIIGMSIISAFISLPFLFSNEIWENRMKLINGFFSLGFGIFLMGFMSIRIIQLL